MYAQGNTQFGQMTAGSYCYIGPQGIVHGTTITLMNAARKFLGSKSAEDMKGKVFVTAGLGGMSGAQPKAGVIAGMIAVVAEVDPAAWQKRYEQGWIQHKERDLEKVISMIKEARKTKSTLSIGWLGNVVTLWERLAEEEENIVDLGSDQTSLHNPFQGGYYPVTMSFEKAREMMANDPAKFR
jgi:urocanate hydratase